MTELSFMGKLMKAMELSKMGHVGMELTYFDVIELLGEIKSLKSYIAELEADLKDARELIGMTPEPAFPAWIPVSERLPEDISNVLVLSRGEQLIGSYHSEYELWYVPFVDKPVVTHWMPLPPSPEAK